MELIKSFEVNFTTQRTKCSLLFFLTTLGLTGVKETMWLDLLKIGTHFQHKVYGKL